MKKTLVILATLAILVGLLPVGTVVGQSEPVLLETPYEITKTWEALTFMGSDPTYASMLFKFDDDGDVIITDDSGNRLVIDPPFPTTPTLYKDGDLIIQSYPKLDVTYDFGQPGSAVKITYTGNFHGRIKFPFISDEYVIAQNGYEVGERDEEGELLSGISYDWSDAIGTVYFDEDEGCAYFDVDGEFDIDPSVVATSSSTSAVNNSNQRLSFYHNGRHWVFYMPGSGVYWKTSLDGDSWSSATLMASGTNYMRDYDIHFDGTYVHYVHDSGGYDYPVYYRRGTPESNGTITWCEDEQTAMAGDPAITWMYPTITTDSGGYPFIVCRRGAPSPTIHIATKSSTNDGTWSTDSGFPFNLGTSNSSHSAPVPLTSGKVYVAYDAGANIKGRLWNGSSWEDEEVADTSAYGGHPISAASSGDVVHLAYMASSAGGYDFCFRERSSGGTWSDEVLIYDNPSTYNVSFVLSELGGGDVRYFWTNNPTHDHIYFKSRVGGTWDTDPTDWISEETDDLRDSNGILSSFEGILNDYVSIVYLTRTASPYNIKYAFMEYIVPEVTTQAATDIDETTATLNGEITDIGGGPVEERGFDWDTDSGAPYANSWTEEGTFGAGTFSHGATGLPPDDTIYFRAKALNNVGWGYGDELTFNTLTPLPGPPTNFTLTESDLDVVTITWTKGTYATTTVIRGKRDSYPEDIVDGYEVYNDTGTSTEHSGLDFDAYVYYYRAWSHNETGYSTTYAEANIGGGNMEFLATFGVFAILSLGLTIYGFHSKNALLCILAGTFWVGFGLYGLQQASGASDVLRIAGFMGLAGALACYVATWYTWKQNRPVKVDEQTAYRRQLSKITRSNEQKRSDRKRAEARRHYANLRDGKQ